MEKFSYLIKILTLKQFRNIYALILVFMNFEIFTNLWKNKQIKEAYVCLKKKLYDKGYSVIDIDSTTLIL